METADVLAPAARPSLGASDDDGAAACERCGGTFTRRTSERVCSNCLAPLRRLRQGAGLTMTELARRVGCRANTIGELEHDAYAPALTLAQALAAELAVDAAELFPSLQVTKEEAGKLLGVGDRTLNRLCHAGELPCDDAGHWHRIEYAAVLRLKAERDEFARDWISLHAATRETGLPWWVLRQLDRAGAFGDDVKNVGEDSGRPIHYVRRTTLDAVRAELVAGYRGVRCPSCRLPVKLGRKAHARCLGALGARAYWRIGADAAARAERSAEHSQLVRRALRAPTRSVREVARWYMNRFGREPTRASLGRWSRWRGGGRLPASATHDDHAAKVAEAKRLHHKHPSWGERTLAAAAGLSRRQVRAALGRNEPPAST